MAEQLSQRGIAYIQWARWSNGLDSTGRGTKDLDVVTELAPFFKGKNVLNGDYTPEKGGEAIEKGQGDAISFGRLFLSNPDLPTRAKHGLPMAPVKYNLAYSHPEGHPEAGYVDYPRADAK